jgi:hypothetical protein
MTTNNNDNEWLLLQAAAHGVIKTAWDDESTRRWHDGMRPKVCFFSFLVHFFFYWKSFVFIKPNYNDDRMPGGNETNGDNYSMHHHPLPHSKHEGGFLILFLATATTTTTTSLAANMWGVFQLVLGDNHDDDNDLPHCKHVGGFSSC